MSPRKPRHGSAPAPRAITPAPAATDHEFDEEIGADIDDFFADQDDSSIVMVYKIGKAGEKDGFLNTFSMASFRNPSCQQVLRDTFGAGYYRCKLKSPDSRGVMRFSGQKAITIAELPPGIGPAATNGRQHSMEDYFRDESQKTQQILLAMIAAQKPPSLDLAGLAALITAVTGGGGKQSDLGSVVAAFTSLKQAADPQSGLSQVKDVLEIAKSISGQPAAAPDGDSDSWPGLIRGALSALTGNAGRPAPRQLSAPAGQPGPDDDDDTQPSEEEMFQRWLAGQLQFLKSKAASNKPVEFWIAYTLENQDEPGAQAIFAALKGGATFENLLQFDPEIATTPALRVWFQKFYDGLRRTLSPATPLPWIVRDSPNVAGHEIPGADRQPEPGNPANSGDPGKP